MNKQSLLLVYRVLLLILGIVGVSIQLYLYGVGMLLYYTVLSNLLVIVFLVYTIYLMLTHQYQRLESDTFLRVKGGVTMAILITFVIYHFLLAPLVEPSAYWNVQNFLVHYIVPLGFAIDTLWDTKNVYHYTDPFMWLVIQLAYSLLALLNGLVLKFDIPGSPDSPYAYFFMNINQLGWRQVLMNSIVIFTAYVFCGYLFLLLKKWIGRSAKVTRIN